MTLLEKIKAIIARKDEQIVSAKCAISRLQKVIELAKDESYELAQQFQAIEEYVDEVNQLLIVEELEELEGRA